MTFLQKSIDRVEGKRRRERGTGRRRKRGRVRRRRGRERRRGKGRGKGGGRGGDRGQEEGEGEREEQVLLTSRGSRAIFSHKWVNQGPLVIRAPDSPFLLSFQTWPPESGQRLGKGLHSR